MGDHSRINLNLIVPVGTQIVLRNDVYVLSSQTQFPRGSVAEITRTPDDASHSYRARFTDGSEFSIRRHEFSILKQVKAGPLGDPAHVLEDHDLYKNVIYRCVVGSRAYGLDRDASDVDRRGIYLAPAELVWSLFGVPEQLENPENEECYWELKKFMVLALKANPNILECLYTPMVEKSTPIADELLAKRGIFLSKLVYQTYNGYVMSQFKKLEQDLRAYGEIKWKHAMHLIRLLLEGVTILKEGYVPVLVSEHRDALLAIREAKMPWSEVNNWRLALHREFEDAFQHTKLPDNPDYAEANRFLVQARRTAAGGATT
ncbi:MAG TPA: nucleotidyltransferase domain-containing protein [Candidatus Angelobacter sp.]|nr:nucleotidyltransferase domain-containing protein [Candidatus Angelobacter sp.]